MKLTQRNIDKLAELRKKKFKVELKIKRIIAACSHENNKLLDGWEEWNGFDIYGTYHKSYICEDCGHIWYRTQEVQKVY